jgi:hypothetical protein
MAPYNSLDFKYLNIRKTGGRNSFLLAGVKILSTAERNTRELEIDQQCNI